ncbi:hypothetical protein E1B28_012067 [Marasmius oreades]|uniref:T6SS Phospholipase effector Tle1-like catalytic domain-containing protein n=1 Tax=Marasmius oreades TaxID=181124 RepID=A0A9P7RQQ2_9AGAR|nr:uncharacterized protein E1B28_012067 [Marasmius oreades]KAG7088031.1 hypothetical protein E1B28_012067 [Marasmius oreades]
MIVSFQKTTATVGRLVGLCKPKKFFLPYQAFTRGKISLSVGHAQDLVRQTVLFVMSDESSSHTARSPLSRPRTLVLCFDGTSSEYDGDNTNVVKFFSLLKKDNCDEQLCYYQAGIGTYFDPGVVSPLLRLGATLLDEAFAWYLSAHVVEGYRFIMQNYKPRDKICMFGFSRGAYTARALGGMLFKIGLLPRDNYEQIPFAYKLYKRTDKEGVELAAGFKDTYCTTVTVEFIGVWDTVSSVGFITNRTLPFTNSNSSVKTFRHALSLDERQAKFRANLYHRPTASDNVSVARKILDRVIGIFCRSGRPPGAMDPECSSESPSTDVLEVWFAGWHGDVGGGAVSNSEPHSLGDISLRWMVRQVMLAQCGILFRDEALTRLWDIPTASLPVPTKANESSLERDRQDAVMPLHDELKFELKASHILWWILEVIPMHYSWQDARDVWHTTFRANLGKGRFRTNIPYFMRLFCKG